MQTLVAAPDQSRFTPIAELARSVIDAPAGPEGVPCVYVHMERIDGQAALVVKTCDDAQNTLLLPETDPQRLDAGCRELRSGEDELAPGPLERTGVRSVELTRRRVLVRHRVSLLCVRHRSRCD